MEPEGIIKYRCEWRNEPILDFDVDEINTFRDRLRNLGLIGVSSDGVGYGNISVRLLKEAKSYVISGTQTGKLQRLSVSDLALVEDFDLEGNFIAGRGEVMPSSEALTHAAIYYALSSINGVIHCHSREIWQKFIGKLPTVPEGIENGTVEMAISVRKIVSSKDCSSSSAIVMAGHKDGVVTFGTTLERAALKMESLFLEAKE